LATNLVTTAYQDATAANGRTNYYQVAAFNSCLFSANSPAVGVFLPLPALSLTTAGGSSITIAWPLWASDWVLYYATNLMAPAFWMPITNPIGSNSTQFVVSVSIASGSSFFRLHAH
jgi:hypothetical protein